MTPGDIQSWVAVGFSGVTAVGVLFNIQQVVRSGHVASRAARKAEVAAIEAASHAAQAVTAIRAVEDKVEEVHLATNSMKDALIESTKTEYYAAGQKDQRDATDAAAQTSTHDDPI